MVFISRWSHLQRVCEYIQTQNQINKSAVKCNIKSIHFAGVRGRSSDFNNLKLLNTEWANTSLPPGSLLNSCSQCHSVVLVSKVTWPHAPAPLFQPLHPAGFIPALSRESGKSKVLCSKNTEKTKTKEERKFSLLIKWVGARVGDKAGAIYHGGGKALYWAMLIRTQQPKPVTLGNAASTLSLHHQAWEGQPMMAFWFFLHLLPGLLIEEQCKPWQWSLLISNICVSSAVCESYKVVFVCLCLLGCFPLWWRCLMRTVMSYIQ